MGAEEIEWEIQKDEKGDWNKMIFRGTVSVTEKPCYRAMIRTFGGHPQGRIFTRASQQRWNVRYENESGDSVPHAADFITEFLDYPEPVGVPNWYLLFWIAVVFILFQLGVIIYCCLK